MNTIGNILWIIIGGGIFIFLEYFIAGLLLCFTIIGIPFGIQAMRLGVLSLMPFGRQVTSGDKPEGCLSTLMNIIWILAGGIWVASDYPCRICCYYGHHHYWYPFCPPAHEAGCFFLHAFWAGNPLFLNFLILINVTKRSHIL